MKIDGERFAKQMQNDHHLKKRAGNVNIRRNTNYVKSTERNEREYFILLKGTPTRSYNNHKLLHIHYSFGICKSTAPSNKRKNHLDISYSGDFIHTSFKNWQTRKSKKS